MSLKKFSFSCPNCSNLVEFEGVYLEIPPSIQTWCVHCYYPIEFYTVSNTANFVVRAERKNAFLINSADKKEKHILDYFASLLSLHGISSFMIESDTRPVDWLQKSLDGIRDKDLVVAFLTRRYQYTNTAGIICGWKAPDKCYDEIAIAFALQKPILALVENEVDPGNVLSSRAWCFSFSRLLGNKSKPLDIEFDFFHQLMSLTGTIFR